MGYDIGPRISVKGEKTFNDQIRDIHNNLKLLGSNLNAVSKKFEANADSIEAVSEKNEIMIKQFDVQKSKLTLLKKQYENQEKTLDDLKVNLEKVTAEYGENHIEAAKARNAVKNQTDVVNKLGISINETQGFINKLNTQIKNNSERIKELSDIEKKSMTPLSQLNTLIDKQKTNLNRLTDEYKNAVLLKGKDSDEARKLETQIKSLSTELGKNVDALKDVNKQADEVSGSLEEIETGAKDAGDGFTVMKGAMSELSADIIKDIAGELKNMATEAENASAQFAASTGISAESMKQYNDQMNELYKGNYGDSLDDIARSMAEVKQQTKEVDPAKLKDLTKNAIILRDTFDFDVKESIRAAKMLMDQFGISSDEAFNLIAQGAQNGLDKNGDLLDSINEYSVHYKQLNFDAEQFFNSLSNGTASGTFSVDKLGDAVKEFGIRVKDTSKTTTEGFELLGLDADKMRAEFAKGGKSATDAMNKTLNALFKVDDKVKQNQAGVNLFGTMWEDLGIDGVKALMNINGTADRTVDTMKKIDEVKYDTIESQIGELGRSLKKDLFEPIIKDNLPKVKKSVDWAIKTIPKITPYVEKLGKAIVVAFSIKKTNDFKNYIVDLGKKLTDLSTSQIPAVGTAFSKIGNFLETNPWIILATAIAGVGTALYFLSRDEDEAIAKLKETAEEAKKTRESWDELSYARDDAVSKSAGEFDYYSRLKDELKTLADENGKVKEGYEGRANYIINELNDAIGTEISMTDGVIQKYKEQMNTLDDLIEKQKAKSIIDAEEPLYQEAIANQSKALKDFQDAKEKYYEFVKKEEQLVRDLEKKGYTEREIEFRKEMFWHFDEAAAVKSAYEDKKAVVEGYTDTIAKHEYLQKLYAEGGAENIAKINEIVKGSYIDKGKTIALTTEEQIKIQEDEIARLKELAKNGNEEIYKDQISAAEKRLQKLKDDLKNQSSTIDEGSHQTSLSWKNLFDKNFNAFSSDSDKYTQEAFKQVMGVKNGINNNTDETAKAWKYLASQGYAELKNNTYKFTTAGEDYVNGIDKGIKNKRNSVFQSITSLGEKMLSNFKSTLKIHSPSKATEEAGKNFDLGAAKGVDKNKNKVISSISDLGKSMINEMSSVGFNDDFGFMKRKSIDISKELLANAYMNMKTEQTIIIPVYMDGKLISKNTEKNITTEQNLIRMARGY